MDFIMHNNIKFKRFIHNDAIKKRIKEIARDMNNYYLKLTYMNYPLFKYPTML